MDPVVAAVRALQASDALPDSTVGVEPDTHPLIDAVQAANAKFESASAWLRLLKILARTRTDLDRTLFAPEFLLYLVRNIESHVQASTIVSNPPPVATILSDCVRLLLNLCIINRKLVHQLFLSTIVPEAQDADEEDEQKYAEPPPPSPLCSLVCLLPDVRNTVADPEVRFFFVRILMFVLVEPKLARDAIKHAQLYQNLIKTFLQCAEEAKLTEAEQSSAAASASSSSASSAAAPSSGADSNAAAEHRKVVMETLRVLANLSVMQEDGLPSLESVVQSAEPALYTRYLQQLAAILAVGVEIPEECKAGYKGAPEVTAQVEAAQKQAAIDRAARDAEAAAAQAAEAAAAENAPATPAQDPASVSAAPTAAANAGADAPRPATPTSVAGASASTSTSVAPSAAAGAPATAAPAVAAVAPATPLAQFTPLQRDQTRIILALMSRESAESAAAPNANAASLLQIQQDISNILNSAETGAAMLPYLESDGCRAFHSLIQILHRALVWLSRDAARRKEAEATLSPILTVISKIIKLSPVLRAHAKRCIFLDLAEPPAANPDGTPFRKADASNYAMSPAGALNDKALDPDPLSLKVLLIGWIITLNFSLKQIVSECLFRVCGEDTSEYIRLLGFGNAVGLLAEKGLPGFAMLRSTAISMDAVIKSGKKL